MNQTTTDTLRDFVRELIEAHAEKHDPDLPAVRGRMDGSEADVDIVEDTLSGISVKLTDGAKFNIRVERTLT